MSFKSLIGCLLLLSFSFIVVAQDGAHEKGPYAAKAHPNNMGQILDINEYFKNMSQGGQGAFEIMIPDTKHKKVIKAWKSLMKSYKTKVSYVKKPHREFIASNAKIRSISDAPVKIYATFEKERRGTLQTIFVEKDNEFVDVNGPRSDREAVRALLYGFALKQARGIANKDVVKAEKTYNKQKKKMKKLLSTNEKLHKSIEKSKKDIRNNERNIEKSTQELESLTLELPTKEKEVSAQQAIVTGIQDLESDTYKDANSKLSSAKRSYDKMLARQDALHNSIEKSNQSIDSAHNNMDEKRKEIDANARKQESVIEEMKNQEDLIRHYEGKRDNIK